MPLPDDLLEFLSDISELLIHREEYYTYLISKCNPEKVKQLMRKFTNYIGILKEEDGDLNPVDLTVALYETLKATLGALVGYVMSDMNEDKVLMDVTEKSIMIGSCYRIIDDLLDEVLSLSDEGSGDEDEGVNVYG